MKYDSLLLILFFALFPFSGIANNCLVFTSEHELPSSMVNHVYQDMDGVVWISTEDGLSRYDGANFITFRKDVYDSTSIRNNYVRFTYESSSNTFFVGTLTGLQVYDRAERCFSEVTPYINGRRYSAVNVSCLAELDDSTILVGTSGHGLFLLVDDGPLCIVQNEEMLPGCYYIEKVLCDDHGNVWIVTLDKGVFCLNRKYEIVEQYSFGVNESCFSINIGGDGNVYLGSSKGSLVKYDYSTHTFSVVANVRQLHSAIVDLYAADSVTMMIGSDGDGLKVYDVRTGVVRDYNLNLLGLKSQKLKVHSILNDNHNNLWLGCFQQGVILEPAIENDFKYVGSRSSSANNIGACCVMSVSCDGDDNIWVGTDNDGIYLLNKDCSLKKHFSIDNNPALAPRTTLCMFRDSRGKMWAGSYLEGLYRLNERTGRFERVLLDNNRDFNQATSVYSIVEDDRQNIWIAVTGVGIYRINIVTLEQKLFQAMPSGIGYSPTANQLPNAWVNTLLLDGNRLYFGTYDGFGCFDIENENFSTVFGVNRMLSGEVVYSLFQDAVGKIWIGTANGLFCFDPKSNEYDKYTIENGLPSNSISSIQSDEEGNLWISTNNGLSCLISQSPFFANYYASDGLQCNEFSKAASSVNSIGTLFYGGMNGLICFNPQKIKKHYSIPGIRITDFYVHNMPVTKKTLSDGEPIVDCDITKADKVSLSYSDNSFSIEFSAMEFANPERIIYRYSMDGNGWISLQPGNNKVSFSNVKPGVHEFCVRSVDANALSRIRKLTICIAAPWYASRLAYVCYVLSFILVLSLTVLYLKHNHTMRMRILEHKHAEDINEAKLQFFINISHEIRTPMSLIIGPLQKLMSSDSNDERQRTYNIINRNAERILNLINQLMDVRKIDKGQMRLHFEEVNIADTVKDICANFEYQASLQDISLNFSAANSDMKLWVDSAYFDKVVVNILSNAFKFTPRNGEINVVLSEGKDEQKQKSPLSQYVEIYIEDSGTGINNEDITRIFERFYQSAGRNAVSGTGIGLHLTKSLVELHHGTIMVANNENKPGCHFVVRLPVGSGHLSAEELKPLGQPVAAVAEKIISEEARQLPNVPIDIQDAKKVRTKTKFHVLLVEDDDEIRQYVKNELSTDFHVQECVNGVEAMDSILKNTPDIVVSDVMMPIMDGIALCQKIKQNVNVNYLPVVLLTSLTTEKDRIEGLNVGADAYITKPFSVDVLRSTVQNILKNRMILKNKYQGSQSQENNVKKLEISSPDDRLMQRVMKVINANISNPDLSVEMIANTVGISRVHLHRKLKEITNQSTRDFIRNVRLQQAATLLSEKRHCIVEVATIVGFSNAAYFSTAFKDLYGMTPSEYMEQQKDNRLATEKQNDKQSNDVES